MANSRQFMAARTAAWAKSGGPTPQEYGGLKFTAEAANSSVKMKAVGSAPVVTLIKSFDGVNWSDYTVGDVISLPSVGDFVYLAAGEGGNYSLASDADNSNCFVVNGFVASSGDITSLRRFDLVQTPMSPSCYSGLFYDCRGLTSAPNLPSTTLADSCYLSMFRNCTDLTSAPDLPSITLEHYCYRYMFRGCSNLSSIRVYFTSWKTSDSNFWTSGVSSTGTFYKPSALPEEYGTSKIPTGWTVVNID